MAVILYYPEGNRGPVAAYLAELARERPKAFARLVLDLELARKRLKEIMVR